MHVFVAEFGYFHGDSFIVGVFSSNEKALRYLLENYKNVGDWQNTSEWKVDSPDWEDPSQNN